MGIHKTNRIPADLAGNGWYDILGEPHPQIPLDGNKTADVVVVGAGFAGLTAAYRILEQAPDTDVMVLDAQAVGWGAAGRNSGFMIDLPHHLQSESYGSELDNDRNEITHNRLAIDYARSIVNDLGLQDVFDPCGKINAATDGAGIKALSDYAAHLKNLDEDYQILDGDDMAQIIGVRYYQGGLFTPGCVQIQPAAYVRGLANGLRGRCRIHEGCPVLEVHSGDNPSVVTSHGTVTCDKIIMSVNGQVESFGWFKHQLLHVFTYSSLTEPLSKTQQSALGGEASWGVTPAHPMGSSLRRLRDGRLLMRNTFTYNPSMETSEQQVQRIGKQHDSSFNARFPMLDDVKMSHRWGGHLCLSLNSVPVFGEVERNVHVAACQNGLGSVKGTLSGMLIADQVLGFHHPVLQTMDNLPDPKRLPPEPFMSLGAKAKLWWGHRQASADL